MPPSDLPAPASDVELARLMGAWYVLFSNRPLWHGRTHPRFDYEPLEPDADGRPRFRDELRYRQTDILGRTQRRVLVGIGTADRDGQFSWRGSGLRRLVEQRKSAVVIDPDYRWMVLWSGTTAIASGGLDVHTRDPSIRQALLDRILAAIDEHPFLGAGERSEGLFATVQDWYPPSPYRLR